MELPKPTDAHRLLHRFAGDWEGPEVLFFPDGTRGASTGLTTFRVAIDGLLVLGDYEQRSGGEVSYRGHTVFGVDGSTGEACWYWFDSSGMVPAAPSRGRWQGDAVVFVANHPQGISRCTYELLGDRYRFTLETSRDGVGYRTVMRGEYLRTR